MNLKLKLPTNKKFIGFAAILLLVIIFAALYFFLLYPKSEQILLKEVELSTQEQILSTLSGKITTTNSNTFQSTVSLQKKVPVKPLSQQLLLDIEKAEVVSGSFVVSMSFEDSEVEIPEEEQPSTEGTEDVETDPETEQKESIPLPTGVKKITVTLNVESPSYFEFEEFLKILENSERITVVEAIDFTANEEIIETGQDSTPLSYQVILSAFYMPTLSDLIDSLPKMATPEPANKKNPFSQFGDYSNSAQSKTEDPITVNTEKSEDGSEETDASVEGQSTTSEENASNDEEQSDVNTSSSENQEHTVVYGDHLTKIAKQYYGDNYKNGIIKIKEANNLNRDVIRPGQILIIPPLN